MHMFSTLIYNPIYNALVFLINVIPGGDVGLAVIGVTLLVKFILFPFAHKMARMQLIIKEMQPQLDSLKEEYKDDKQTQTLKTLELYREHNISPFFGILVLILQIPIVFGLYWVFYKGGLPVINTDILYSFISIPQVVDMHLLGLIPMDGKSIALAVLAGVTQFINMRIVMPYVAPKSDKLSLKEDLTRSLQLQMKYVMPVLITVFAYMISSAVALYWVTSNIFTIFQELLVRKQYAHARENNHHD